VQARRQMLSVYAMLPPPCPRCRSATYRLFCAIRRRRLGGQDVSQRRNACTARCVVKGKQAYEAGVTAMLGHSSMPRSEFCRMRVPRGDAAPAFARGVVGRQVVVAEMKIITVRRQIRAPRCVPLSSMFAPVLEILPCVSACTSARRHQPLFGATRRGEMVSA